MLIRFEKLKIVNDGYKRTIALENVFINPSHIISVRDYSGINDFLLSEGSDLLSKKTFSLIRINNVSGTEDVIALGSSKEILESLNPESNTRGLLSE